MKNRKVTNEEREEILRRSREGGKGNLQKEIARDLKLSVTTIQKIEAQANLRRNPGYCTTPEQERAILALFLAGHGQPHITEALGIPTWPVREAIAKFRDRQARGAQGQQYQFSAVEKRAIARDLREARRGVAKKWKVTVSWVKEFEAMQRHNHRKAHEPVPFMPKSIDLVRLLRVLLPTGIPFDARHDAAAVAGLMQGVSTFIPLPTKYSEGLRTRFGEAMSMLRKEESGAWLN
jgi:hypothetical protein